MFPFAGASVTQAVVDPMRNVAVLRDLDARLDVPCTTLRGTARPRAMLRDARAETT